MDQADMIELLDGYTNEVVARFDGRNPPREVVNISADFVILYFYSDRTNEAQGFSMIYQGTDHNIVFFYGWKISGKFLIMFFFFFFFIMIVCMIIVAIIVL